MPASLLRRAAALAARSGPMWARTRSFGAKRAASAPSSRPATSAPRRSKGARFGAAAPPASPGPGSSCRDPCRRRGSRRTRTDARRTASRGPFPGRGAALPETCAAPSPRRRRRTAKLIARLGEQCVDRDLGLRREQRVQQARLRRPKAEAVPLDRAHLRQRRVLLQPFLGQHAEAAVTEEDHRVASSQRPQQLGQRRRHPVEVDLSVQIEPVDPAGDR